MNAIQIPPQIDLTQLCFLLQLIQHACDTERQTRAPHFAGHSKEACDVCSGTWSPNPRDCSTSLKLCVDNATTTARDDNKTACLLHLEASPTVGAPTEKDHEDQCGDAREHFGFDRDFPGDDQMCEEIERLRCMRDLERLDVFANSAGSTDPGPGKCLKPPEEGKHKADRDSTFAISFAHCC